MAQKGSAKQKATTTVRRITAKDDAPKKTQRAATPKKAAESTKKSTTFTKDTTPRAYLRGAWSELKLVRWPTRATTWQMVAAVIGFTFLLTAFILLLDAGFQFLFELILK
ncbi:MAG: preprotein translocase subunit SecE [Candidatus Saccharibacteria bacterium]|nr:preprotein translocase subunit SecE [Candidatus Saccharibacteria bacterium]